ncbi:hypothetical protein [Actinoplanes sp. L3-i22]|uniref:hypothetical protein n=1 Tax=Actinoplanes sp. L3-i22 TaxID=2836373 RepID=UPI001C77E244|nr:hypothetical protein [Actinoplanes sp. L3-i22]BCY10960.1 hypothetical protein L3i22_060480 [Actinoplanes sp. L3-i22]
MVAAELGETSNATIGGHVTIGGDGQQTWEGVAAGACAVARWAARHGLTAPADRVDAASTGAGDFQLSHDHDVAKQDIARRMATADRLVVVHWPAIARVADALVTRGRLTGDEIAGLAGFGVTRLSAAPVTAAPTPGPGDHSRPESARLQPRAGLDIDVQQEHDR